MCGTGKGFDVAFDDVRGVRRGRVAVDVRRPQGVRGNKRQRARSRVAGREGNEGVAVLFDSDEMVAVAVQAVLSSV